MNKIGVIFFINPHKQRIYFVLKIRYLDHFNFLNFFNC